jgi:hypothetical protein
MSNVTSELINLFTFLLPGFITSFLFYSLRASPKKSEIEMVVMALIYTTIINTIVELLSRFFFWVGKKYGAIAEWDQSAIVICSVILSVLLGLLLSLLYNNDAIHKPLRKIKVTKQTSYPSEWYGAFYETLSFVVLHFTDGRRLMGWPREWPSDPKSGHFILEQAAWLTEEEGQEKEINLDNVEKILVDTTNIIMVEFVRAEMPENVNSLEEKDES